MIFMKRTIQFFLFTSLLFIAACSSNSDESSTNYTGEVFISGNTVYLTDCSTGIKYEVSGNNTELISGAKDRITSGENQVFATIQAETLEEYKLQLIAIDGYLDQPPASCTYHMGYLTTLAKTQWKITADEKDLQLEMNEEEWILTVEGQEILFPPVNARITNKFLEYDSSTLWNDNQSFIRIAIMPRSCENTQDERSFYTVITLDNELIKACASMP